MLVEDLSASSHEDSRISGERERERERFWCGVVSSRRACTCVDIDEMYCEPFGISAGQPPSLARGQVTFGRLNDFFKVNDDTLDLRAGVLRAMRSLQLLLQAPGGSARKARLERPSRSDVPAGSRALRPACVASMWRKRCEMLA